MNVFFSLDSLFMFDYCDVMMNVTGYKYNARALAFGFFSVFPEYTLTPSPPVFNASLAYLARLSGMWWCDEIWWEQAFCGWNDVSSLPLDQFWKILHARFAYLPPQKMIEKAHERIEVLYKEKNNPFFSSIPSSIIITCFFLHKKDDVRWAWNRNIVTMIENIETQNVIQEKLML